MRLHLVEVLGGDGKRADYSGPLGHTLFEHGVSTVPVDVDSFQVRRILRPEDGGAGLGYTVAIVRYDTDGEEPGGESPPAPAPAPTQPAPDRMAKARAARAAKRAVSKAQQDGSGSGG